MNVRREVENKKMNPIFFTFPIIFVCVFIAIFILNIYKIRINLTYLKDESRAPIFKQKLKSFSIRYIPITVVIEGLWIIFAIGLSNDSENDSILLIFIVPITVITILTFASFIGLPDFQKLELKSKIQQYKVLKDYYLAGFYSYNIAEHDLNKGNMLSQLRWNLKALDFFILFMNEKKLNIPIEGDKPPLSDSQKRQIAFILNVIVTLLHTMQNLKNYEKMSLVTQIGLQASSRFPNGSIDSANTNEDLEMKKHIQEIRRFHAEMLKKKE